MASNQSIKEQLRGNMVAAHYFYNGTLLDQSPNSNDATVAGAPAWVNSDRGQTLKLDNAADYVDVGDTSGTVKSIFFMFKEDDITANTDYVVDLNGTDYISIVNGTVTVNGFAAASTNIIVDGNSGAIISNTQDFFTVLVTSDTGFAASDVDYGRLEGTGFLGGKLQQVILFDNELSSQQGSELHDEVSVEPFIGTLAKRNFQLPNNITGVETGLVGGWNMNMSGETVVDVSSGLNDLTKFGGVISETGVFGDTIRFNGTTGYLKKSVAGYRESDSSGTIEAVITPQGSGLRYIWSTANDAVDTVYFGVRLNASHQVELVWVVGAATVMTGDTALTMGQTYHIAVKSNGSTYSMFVDGVEETLTETAGSNDGAWMDGLLLRDNILVGVVETNSGFAFYYDGSINYVTVYSTVLSDAKLLERATEAKAKLIYNSNLKGEPITLGSALGAGEVLSDGQVQTGTWKIDADSTGHHFLCVTDGQVKIPLENAANHTTNTFSISGTPTLTKNTNDLQLDAVAGEKIYSVIITL